MGAVARRPAGPEDDRFLRELDAAVRGRLFTGTGWDERARAQMLDLQFAARRADRAASFPAAREEVILLDGQPVGALVVDTSSGVFHLLDLALVPGSRGQGIGSAVVTDLVGEGAARVEVEATNAGARRFFERLGFEVDGGDGVTLTLRRASGPATR
jgi:ribosomal protein S18 acetylase RimI-like enzyme